MHIGKLFTAHRGMEYQSPFKLVEHDVENVQNRLRKHIEAIGIGSYCFHKLCYT